MTWLRRALATLRDFYVEQAELHERMALLNRPWEEEYLHWVREEDGWRLHGHALPPPDGRRRSVTRQGWCPARRHPTTSR